MIQYGHYTLYARGCHLGNGESPWDKGGWINGDDPTVVEHTRLPIAL